MKHPSNPMIALMDLVALVIMCLPMVMTIIAESLILKSLGLSLLSSVFIGILILPFLFIIGCFLVRLCLPKLKKGQFPVGLNIRYAAWGMHLALNRSIAVFQLKDFVFSSYILKWLYWRAMGAKIAFGINSSMYITMVDLPLLTIERGVTIGDKVHIACHILTNGKILLGEVKIGEGTFIGIESTIGPMSKIGKNCFIAPEQKLFRARVKDGESVGKKE